MFNINLLIPSDTLTTYVCDATNFGFGKHEYHIFSTRVNKNVYKFKLGLVKIAVMYKLIR